MMRVAPVSADLLIKLAIAAGVAAAAWYAYRRVADAMPTLPSAATLAEKVASAASATADAVNPASPTNLVNRAVTATGQAVTKDSGWTLGGWLYDITHADPLAPKNPGKDNPSSFDLGMGAG